MPPEKEYVRNNVTVINKDAYQSNLKNRRNQTDFCIFALSGKHRKQNQWRTL